MTNLSRANLDNGIAIGPQGEGRESPSTFPAYPVYKDSSVGWLGVVPEHWAVTLLKRGYEVVLGKMLQPEARRDDDELLPYLRAANIQLSGVDTVDVKRMWFGAGEKKSLLLRRGDLLVSEGGDVGRSAIWGFDEECYFQNSINRIRSFDGNDTRFLYFWMISIKENGYIDVLCNKSTIAHFTAEKVSAVPLPIPTKPEQTQIARFLDHETARIDALIVEQQRLIELLKEKRQALISHAVTKGLAPTVPMKDSGVEWLGEVPAHWDVVPTNYRYEIQLGRMLNEQRAQGDNLKPYLRVFDVQWNAINTTNLPLMDFPPEVQPMYRLKSGDLMVNEGGSYVGRSAIWRGDLDECYYQKALHRLRPRDVKRDTAEFFLHVMEMATQQGVFVAGGNQTTIDHLTAEQLRQYRFAFPPFDEQLHIAEKITEMVSKIQNTTAEAEQLIGYLQERRSALISAAVTGKIDVRSWQPPPPELAQETL
ncbi:restriction endonuclease subunit S [Pseudomonas costantinii]|uniref:restriction endonuclease subunit S n=1 Tax=Pseudomonas costantinii TaxID=168469 RepID=UPI0015A1FD32|nr:restriction endonuclease subunit S [Pseudomonas costantinii]NVZ21043.1 restriction endonuclease subunit S [Pseudomonas costantinii]